MNGSRCDLGVLLFPAIAALAIALVGCEKSEDHRSAEKPKRADVNGSTRHAEKALHRAASLGDKAAAELLLPDGAEPKRDDARGEQDQSHESLRQSGKIAAVAVLQGKGKSRMTQTEHGRLNAFATSHNLSSAQGRLGYIRKLAEVVGHDRAAKMEVRFYNSQGHVVLLWPHRQVDMVTFIKAFAKGEADKYKGFVVRGGGGAAGGNTQKGKGGHSHVFVCGKRPDGSFYRIVKTSSGNYNFDGSKDRLFAVLLLWLEDNMPEGCESGSVKFVFKMMELCQSFQARFYGTYSELTLSQSGQKARKERGPVLVWEGAGAKDAEHKRQQTGQ